MILKLKVKMRCAPRTVYDPAAESEASAHINRRVNTSLYGTRGDFDVQDIGYQING
jgi:hypothetical protein